MYLEAKETARLYALLSDKLGNDITEAMFKYIDNKTERSVEATIKTLATKDDLNNEMSNICKALHKSKNDIFRLMFFLAVAQVIAQWLMFYYLVK